MKYILLLIISGIVWMSCQDITVGFLKTENADYGYDTLIVRKVLDENLDYDRIQNKAPWVTKPIQGVIGTKPILYDIEIVEGPNAEAVEIFKNEIQVIGTGIMYYPFEHKAPAGAYKVTLRVSNEGYSHLLPDIFTFIIE